jgi:hypothetical protein
MNDNAFRQDVARAVLDDLEDRRGIRGPLLTIRAQDPAMYAEIFRSIGDRVAETLRRYREEP